MSDSPVELPPYRAVLVVDTKEFGGNPDVGQHALADAVEPTVQLAFERAGLGDVLRDALFPHNTGDGFGIGFDTKHLPAVIDRLFDTLQDVLAEQDVRFRAGSRRVRMRMRASLNVGPVRQENPDRRAAVAGRAVVETHRLLDAAPVREVLDRSDPDQTFLSVALSRRVYEDVVEGGFTTLTKSRLTARTVTVKELSTTVYLYIPRLSGELLERGAGEPATPADVPRSVERKQDSVTTFHNSLIGGTHGMTIQVGQLNGELHQS